MKALLITTNYPPVGGGVSRYYEGLVDAADGRIGVAGPNLGQPMPNGNSIAARLAQVMWARRVVASSPREVNILAGQPHIALGSMLARRPFGLFIHGGEWESYPAGGHLLTKLLPHAQVIVTTSGATAQRWVPQGLAQRIIILRPGLPSFVNSALGASPPISGGFSASAPMRILAVARLSPRKGLRRLLLAIDQCVDEGVNVTLDLVGDGPEASTLIHQIRNTRNFRLHREASDQALTLLYKSAHLFALLPQEISGGEAWEGFGIVFLEAAGHGLGILCTRTGGVPESTIATGSVVLDERCSSQEVAAAIKSLYDSPGTLTEMGSVNRTWAQSQSWSHRKPLIDELLDSLEQPRNRGSSP